MQQTSQDMCNQRINGVIQSKNLYKSIRWSGQRSYDCIHIPNIEWGAKEDLLGTSQLVIAFSKFVLLSTIHVLFPY